MSNKAKDKNNVKENLNKSPTLIKKNNKNENQKEYKQVFNLDKSFQISKNSIKDKMMSGDMKNKDIYNNSIESNNIPNFPNKKQKK